MTSFEQAKYDLNYEIRKRHDELIHKCFTDALGHEPGLGDVDRMEIAHVSGSLTDVLKLDGKTIGKVQHVNENGSYKVQLVKPE